MQADVKPNERSALITYTLSNEGVMKASELAEICEVSVRTIYRDLQAIERIVPLARDGFGGIFILRRDDD